MLQLKTIALVALVCAAVAAVFAVQQRQTAADLRNRIVRLGAEIQQKDAAANEQAALLEKLRQENEAYINEAAALRQRLAALRAAPTERRGDSASSAPAPNPVAKNIREFFETLAANPMLNEQSRFQQRKLIEGIYGDFASSRRLNPDESRQLFELLIQKGLVQLEDGTNALGGDGADGADAASNAQSAAQRIAEIDRNVQKLLGDARYADFLEYNRTAGERVVLRTVEEGLEENGVSLTEQQNASLLQVLMEERARTPASPLAPADVSPRDKMRDFFANPNQDQLYQAEADLNRRVINRVAGILDPKQLEVVSSALNQRLEEEKLIFEAARVVLEDRKSAAAGR